jgi:AcrR family transcriptional regulator
MTAEKRPAHRPSRRDHILQSAIQIFARQGYADANIEDVAAAAGVAATAIYYHFGGKEQLFYQALEAAMNGFTESIVAARPDTEPGHVDALRRTLRAGWDWWHGHPDHAVVVARYSTGSTPAARALRRGWEQRHRTHASDYLGAPARGPRSGRKAREQQAVDVLAMSVLLDIGLVSQVATVEGGPLGRLPKAAVRAAVEEVCVRLGTYRQDPDPATSPSPA